MAKLVQGAEQIFCLLQLFFRCVDESSVDQIISVVECQVYILEETMRIYSRLREPLNLSVQSRLCYFKGRECEKVKNAEQG